MYYIPKNVARPYRTWAKNYFRIYGYPVLYFLRAKESVYEDLYGMFVGDVNPSQHEDSVISGVTSAGYYVSLVNTFYVSPSDKDSTPFRVSSTMWGESIKFTVHVELFREAFNFTPLDLNYRYPQPGDIVYSLTFDELNHFTATVDKTDFSEEGLSFLDGDRYYIIQSVDRYIRAFYEPQDHPIMLLTATVLPIRVMWKYKEGIYIPIPGDN